MTKPVLLPTISQTAIILLVLLALPLISSAEQVEDISEIEQKVQSLDVGTANNSNDQSSSAWKRLLGFIGFNDGRPATSTEQKSMPSTAFAIKASAEQDPVVTPEKAEQDRIASEKAANEKMATEKAGQVRATKSNTPVTTQKAPETQSSSKWQGFLSLLGLHDDRHSIPPLEVLSAPLHLGQDYIIGPGDLLAISVWRDDSLTRSVVVLPDGKIQFPLIGEIVAGSKSVAQLKKEFVEKLSSYVVDADISVEVKQSNSLFIYIIGRVNSPGRQMLLADTTVLQALAMAGGLNPFAEKNDIKIFRQESERTLVYSFRYSQVVSGNYLDDNLLLKRGDVIVVP